MDIPTIIHDNETFVDLWCLYEHGKNINKSFFSFSNPKKRSDWVKRKIPKNNILRVLNGQVSQQRNAAFYIKESYANAHMYLQSAIKDPSPVIEDPPTSIKDPPAAIVEPPAAIVKRTYPLPKLISIDDDDMGFRNEDGKHLEIEMRGERSKDGIFFKAYDVQKCMGIRSSINDILQHKTSAYEYNTDYVYFETPAPQTDPVNHGVSLGERGDNGGNRTGHTLFLTFPGLMRLLYSKHKSNYILRWTKWADTVLFTCIYGSRDEKIEFSAKLLKKEISAFSKMIANSNLSVLYLIRIGTVKDLRAFNEQKLDKENSMRGPKNQLVPINVDELQDDQVLYKYGETSHFEERYKEHSNQYGVMCPSSFTVVALSIVDKDDLKTLEKMLEKQFEDMGIRYVVPGHNELIIYNKQQSSSVENLFKQFAKDHNSCIAEYKHRIELFSKDLDEMRLKHQIELKDVQHQMELKDAQHQLELQAAKHQADINGMRIELLEMKLNNKKQ